MLDTRIGTDLPLDVSSRIRGLLSLVTEITERVNAHPVLTELLYDYQQMAREYILLFEQNISMDASIQPREKWLKQHEMLDKLTREWQLIYSLASAMELGSPHLAEFMPYVEQAVQDLGLKSTGENFLLIPVFGESFSLTKISYSSSNIAILNLPLSVIFSPWELSVIWHEMAGLKVVEIREQIKTFLGDYAKANGIEEPEHERPDDKALKDLFSLVMDGKPISKKLKLDVRAFLTNGGAEQHPVWSQDWFEQLYEDACSVFAFGEEFVSVLEKILGRQERKLTADRKHPNLTTRLTVAHRLLVLQEGTAPAPQNETERLTDELLWNFINRMKTDPVARLPVAYTSRGNMPELRRELIRKMKEFNDAFGDLETGAISETRFEFGPMTSFAQKASQAAYNYVSDEQRTVRVKEKLDEIFKDAGVNELLAKPFSPSDELNFYEHSATDFWQTLYIGSSSHGGHYILHLSHA